MAELLYQIDEMLTPQQLGINFVLWVHVNQDVKIFRRVGQKQTSPSLLPSVQMVQCFLQPSSSRTKVYQRISIMTMSLKLHKLPFVVV